MNHRIKTVAIAILALLAAGSATGAAAAASAVLLPAGEVKWAHVPGFPGVQMAAVGGNPAKGPHHSMLKFTGGFAAPLHHHTTDHYGTVVTGTLVLTSGGKEVRLPPGSYFAFTGKMPHMTKCEAGADCVLAIDARGKWDVVPEKAKPGKK